MIELSWILAFSLGGRGAAGTRGSSSVCAMLVATLGLGVLADREASALPMIDQFADGEDGGTERMERAAGELRRPAVRSCPENAPARKFSTPPAPLAGGGRRESLSNSAAIFDVKIGDYATLEAVGVVDVHGFPYLPCSRPLLLRRTDVACEDNRQSSAQVNAVAAMLGHGTVRRSETLASGFARAGTGAGQPTTRSVTQVWRLCCAFRGARFALPGLNWRYLPDASTELKATRKPRL